MKREGKERAFLREKKQNRTSSLLRDVREGGREGGDT